jgi:murein DD-endopeptidase MepM/ murein hydrolase activator NlpD
VFAAAAGRVVFTGELKVRGNAIMVDHGAGLFTAYHHLSAISVADGDFVTPGQQIGAIGSTGLATGAHLHWEVIVRGVEVDGQLWLEGTEVGP